MIVTFYFMKYVEIWTITSFLVEVCLLIFQAPLEFVTQRADQAAADSGDGATRSATLKRDDS